MFVIFGREIAESRDLLPELHIYHVYANTSIMSMPYQIPCDQPVIYGHEKSSSEEKLMFPMVGLRGLEPPTPAMSTRYSNQLSYKPIWCRWPELNRYGLLSPRDFKSRASASSATSAWIVWRRHSDLNWGIEVLQTSALPLGYAARGNDGGAGDEIRTRDFHLGEVTLYHWVTPAWCLRTESNRRHEDFQSSALPTELPRQIVVVTRTGFEPV